MKNIIFYVCVLALIPLHSMATDNGIGIDYRDFANYRTEKMNFYHKSFDSCLRGKPYSELTYTKEAKLSHDTCIISVAYSWINAYFDCFEDENFEAILSQAIEGKEVAAKEPSYDCLLDNVGGIDIETGYYVYFNKNKDRLLKRYYTRHQDLLAALSLLTCDNTHDVTDANYEACVKGTYPLISREFDTYILDYTDQKNAASGEPLPLPFGYREVNPSSCKGQQLNSDQVCACFYDLDTESYVDCDAITR